MKEIGGYIELAAPAMKLHQGAVRLNSGRNCLAYLIEARNIQTIWIPDYLCDSVFETCCRYDIEIERYSITESFEPDWKSLNPGRQDYLYLVDYFGQLTDLVIDRAKSIFSCNLIIDEVQSLFTLPRKGLDTLYSPRKFLGIPDGGLLYTDSDIGRCLPRSESRSRMEHLLGRLETSGSAYYEVRKRNDEALGKESVMRMSLLTEALIGSIDIDYVKNRRARNFETLATVLDDVNGLTLEEPIAPFAYPLLVKDGIRLRRELAERGIYVPTLWPNVLDEAPNDSVAYHYAANILPLPCDQRYNYGDMERVIEALRELNVISKPLAGKRIAILGGTRISCEIVRCAKRLGMHTTVIDYNEPEDSPGKQIADEHALISVADSKAVADYVMTHHIDGVITGYSDTLLPMYADICSFANLPCYGTRTQFEIFTDKAKWKELCRQYKVPTADEYNEDYLRRSINDLPLPLFVKPADGAGARGTSIVRNPSELLPAIDHARSFARNSRVLIEDYLEGPEVTIFWLFIDGNYKVFLIGNRLVKHNQSGTIPLPAGYTFPASVLPRYMREVAPKVEKMLGSLKIRNGMMFMQCIVQEGLPFVYDIGYRLTGSLEQYLTKQCAGYSPMEMLLNYAVSGKMTNDPYIDSKIAEGLQAPCYNISILMKPGTIDHFDGINQVLCDSSVIEVVKAHIEGETLPPEAKGELRQIALRVLGAVNDSGDLRDTMMGLQSAVKIVSQEEEDLMLPGLDPSDFESNVLLS